MLAPYDAEDARGLLKAAIRDPDPVVFLENEILYGEAFPVDDKILDKDFTVPIGKVKVTSLTTQKPNSLESFACSLALSISERFLICHAVRMLLYDTYCLQYTVLCVHMQHCL